MEPQKEPEVEEPQDELEVALLVVLLCWMSSAEYPRNFHSF